MTQPDNSQPRAITRILIANRGEVAIRIARAAADLGISTCGVFATDDGDSRHRQVVDQAIPLAGSGAAAYLDAAALAALAHEYECDAVHPGYGFLSESAAFAAACLARGLIWIGAAPDSLRIFGDKEAARDLARESGVPVIAGSGVLGDVEAAAACFHEMQSAAPGPALLKAVAGGGGRGMRIVRRESELSEAFARAASEAQAAFGSGALYMERLLERARHIEIQIVGDRYGNITHLGERECTLQRRHQKLVEVAPAPFLPENIRTRLTASALRLARATDYEGLGTFEFLVFPSGDDPQSPDFAFIEANARLQVEHTVTEAVSGVDLVQTQIRLAAGTPLPELPELAPCADSSRSGPAPRGFAIQLRVNAESMDALGCARPSAGRLASFETPGGPGVRVDTAAFGGYELPTAFDSLLAKLIVHSPGGTYADALAKASRSLREFRVRGVDTNLSFLGALLAHPEVRAHRIYTRFVDDHIAELIASAPADVESGPAGVGEPLETGAKPAPTGRALDIADSGELPDGAAVVRTPMRAKVIDAGPGQGAQVVVGATLAVLEAMKMEHAIVAPANGIVWKSLVEVGDIVQADQALFVLLPGAHLPETLSAEADLADDPDQALRADLQEVLDRHAATGDAARPRAVARRRKRGQRTARANIADLCDAGSFQEYGGLALAAQRGRRSLQELIEMSPADGLVTGVGAVNGDEFSASRARCAVMSYDYTVFAGTQGAMNHKKTDRLLHIIRDLRLPLVVFAEGGGGRPGDSDVAAVAGLDLTTFRAYAGLSGLAPRIAIASGRCFAGNAALFGCSDITIATADATIGMGGPVMIKGGGLGNFRAEEVGPADMQAKNGVVDVLVADEAEAVREAKRALAYFQGDLADFRCADQRLLRQCVPAGRRRVYDTSRVIDLLADEGSVLELRREFAPGMVTALIRVGGRPLGLIANRPAYLAGAIDAAGADKAARFLQLCDAFDLPVLSLCDTPGIMVGPAAEREALVRHAARLFLVAGSLSVPLFAVVLRKGYGLGAMAMAGGGFHAPVFTVAWPTGEFGAMGLEGAVRIGYQKELAEVADWDERQALFEKLVEQAYEQGKAINMASYLEIDDVIDPAESRNWILRGLASLPPTPHWSERGAKKRMIDAW